jgi:hypothetical protein
VIVDMRERDRFGVEKYKTRLQPFNGRNPLVDAYQEALDLCVYLRQAMYEEAFKSPGYGPSLDSAYKMALKTAAILRREMVSA